MSELKKSLVAVQAEIKDAFVDGVNKFYDNARYATLESVLKVGRPIWTKHGLAVKQSVILLDGKQWLQTSLIHGPSGHQDDTLFPLILTKQDMQGLGSAVTYARRYSIEAIFGMGEVDDDGNQAIDENIKDNEQNNKKETKEASFKRPQKPKSNSPATGLSDEIVEFGKFQGQTFHVIGYVDLKNYIEYLEGTSKKSNKPLEGKAKNLVDQAKFWFQEQEAINATLLKQDEIPF